MQYLKEDSTTYLYFDETSNLAFPDLDKIGVQLVPLFDLKERVFIDEEQFVADFGFTYADDSKSHGITIAFAVIGSFMLLLAILGHILYCIR
jgi:hypothetical protein